MRHVEDTALDIAHEIKGRADHPFILAQQEVARHLHRRALQCADDAIFAFHLMGRFQQRAGRLLAQHHAPSPAFQQAPAFQQKSRIGLAALELPDPERAGCFGEICGKIVLQRRLVEALRGQWIDKPGHGQDAITPPSATRTCPVT
ncbi:hypothetical protein BG36_01305 [Aquamicrobium defluvii]|uniref:Uncharacterized protein n=1 Tax=Aquamicrobium defluvii TaxID=69279 RepID=A0A011UXM4_9HYPH|nr:hypothetical protein BG36_01305 [Aquamicrobium defluvii]EZQ17815.1 hypothetical protein CF98_32925 [Halopseudomonas bauzanensis]